MLSGHGVVEANRGDIVVHASEERGGPLPAILGPNSKEAPHLTLTLNLWAHVKFHQTFGKVLSDCVDLVVTSPGVVSELRLTLFILFRQLRPCAQERLVASGATVALEQFEHGVAGSVLVGNPIEVVIVLRVDTIAD